MDYVIYFLLGLAGHLIGTLVGGGGLISLPTMLLMGVPIHSAIGANKVGSVFSSLANVVQIVSQKEMATKYIKKVFILGLVGGGIGGALAVISTEEVMTIIALILMIFAFIMSFMKGNMFGLRVEPILDKKTSAQIIGIGIYDGMFGPGSSTLSIYMYARQQLSYFASVAFTRTSLLAWCIGSLVFYISAGKMIWSIAFAVSGGAVIGGYLGLKLTKVIKPELANLLLRTVTIILLVQLTMKVFT